MTYDITNTHAKRELYLFEKLVDNTAKKYEETIRIIKNISLIEEKRNDPEELERLSNLKKWLEKELRTILDYILQYRYRIRENEQAKNMNDGENRTLTKEDLLARIEMTEANRTRVHNTLMKEIETFQRRLILILGYSISEESLQYLQDELLDSNNPSEIWEDAYVADSRNSTSKADLISLRKLYENKNTSLYIKRG
jgi:hypothetical protein